MVAISYLAGTIGKEETFRFKKLVFRATRGKAYTYFRDLDTSGLADYSGTLDKRLRSVYVIVFQEGVNTRSKLTKICESFMGHQIDVPQAGFGAVDIANKVRDLQGRILEASNLMKLTRNRLKDYLREMQKVNLKGDEHDNKNISISLLEVYRVFLQKEKLLYSTLNKFKVEEKLYLGFCWVPRQDQHEILRQVENLKELNRNIEIPTLKIVKDHGIRPPSKFRLNEVTWVFQEIVNTYGIPTYKEVNPSVFAIVTFPFLFGVMFGDIGHGFVLFLVGAALCLTADIIREKAPAMEPVLGLRYIFLLMGLFATFAGLIYNDFMAIPLWIWDSCFDLKEIHSESHHAQPGHEGVQVSATLKPDCVYPIGVDPVWHLGSNELSYLNSLKMKISVILGVLQMGLGVCMKAFNAVHFGNKLDFFFEFVPQITLLFVLFGYMDWMIIAKWSTDFTGKEYMAPSIISNMIDMALKMGQVAPGTAAVIGDASTQQTISILFLVIALICAPMMLFPKPFIIRSHMLEHAHKAEHDDVHNKQSVQMEEKPMHSINADNENQKLLESPNREEQLQEIEYQTQHQKNDWRNENLPSTNQHKAISSYKIKDLLRNEPSSDGGHGSNFVDIFIHQLIETIEFVLGTISNTASYLRLWALSLAHGQLAAVFIENTILPALEAHSVGASFFGVWIGYFLWVTFTIGVLMSMDVMECFLHTLRLHWVEF